jgi:ribosome-associated translation inhibitor RaiA/cold shock CspA family protein
MQVPLELAFVHVDPTDWAEGEIRDRLAKLEKNYGEVVSCRVRIERPNRSIGVPPVVHLELGIAGRPPMVVSHDPGHLRRKFQSPDLHNAIHEAFRIAERQLHELKEKRHGRSKQPHHDDENQFLGRVAELHPEDDHGFLQTKEGGLLYFHRNSILAGDFDSLKTDDEVRYVEDIGDTGPIATKVRVKAAATG